MDCRSYAKGFGAMGALFAGSECVIEKTRAKHDMYNSIYAGKWIEGFSCVETEVTNDNRMSKFKFQAQRSHSSGKLEFQRVS